tara:strand:+ start:58 stop:489 length:432 start_codon:yes stop_codon:yes gene_type:complete
VEGSGRNEEGDGKILRISNVSGGIIAGRDVNINYSGDNPKGWKYEIRVGHNVAELQTWTTDQVKETFAGYLADIEIHDFETGETIGSWKGEPEDSNLMVIIRKAEDGDAYDDLLVAVKMANKVLKQEAILTTKINLSEVDFVS